MGLRCAEAARQPRRLSGSSPLPSTTHTERLFRFLVIDTTLGLVLVVSGLVAWERRPAVRTGPLLVGAGALWSVGSYAPAGVMPFALYGFAFERYYDILFAYLALTFPDRRLPRWDRAVLVLLAGASW